VDDLVDECSDRDIAQQKIDWWRNEILATFDGKPQHPVAIALQQQVVQIPNARHYLLDILNGMEMDLTFQGYETMADLEVYAYRVAGVVGLMAAHIFGFQHPDTLQYAKKLGLAFQLTNIIRDVREDACRGRIYLPKEDLLRFQIRYEDIEQLQHSAAFEKLMQFEVERAKTYYREALALLSEEDRYSQRVGLIMANIYQTLLQEIEMDQYRVLEHRIKLTPVRKLWIAWSTARREKKRHCQQQITRFGANR
jgi:phytoene synthase